MKKLSMREREVLGLLLYPMAAKSVAQKLGLSIRTIENHSRKIRIKTETSSLIEIASRIARRCGIELAQETARLDDDTEQA